MAKKTKRPARKLKLQRTLEVYHDARHDILLTLRRPTTVERAAFEESVPAYMQAVDLVVRLKGAAQGIAHIPVHEFNAVGAFLQGLIIRAEDKDGEVELPDDYVAMSGPGAMFALMSHVQVCLLLLDMGTTMRELEEAARGD